MIVEQVVEDSLHEGALYTVRNGTLVLIPRDEDDATVRKVRISEQAFQAVTGVQKRMRKVLSGYKPDVSLVASAMLIEASKQDAVVDAVRDYAVSVFTKSDKEVKLKDENPEQHE